MNSSGLESEIREIIAKITEKDPFLIKLDTHLIEDLGADSMMILEIMVTVDKKYKIEIAEQDIPKMNTLNEIMGAVSKLLRK